MVVVRQRWTRARSRQGRGDWIWCACEAWDGTGGPHMLGTSGHRGGGGGERGGGSWCCSVREIGVWVTGF
jgi:hypothetical protein